MALSPEEQSQYAAFGIDVNALAAAVTKTEVVSLPYTPKAGEIKVGAATYHLYDTDGHNGLLGRVKSEVLTQATELGVKAVAKAANVEYTGNDPLKLLEAVTAKLKLPVEEKVAEKERDIATMRTNWETEKANREAIEARLKDREETDRDISFFPENRVKIVSDATLRAELKAKGITYGEHEGKPAVFVNGIPQKNADLTLVDPKVFTAAKFKEIGWEAAAAPAGPAKPKTFDTKDGGVSKPAFDHDATYKTILEKNGNKWDEKAQAEYTQAYVEANKTS